MFNEHDTEYSKKQGKEIPVWQSPKYLEAKQKAIELINSNKYNLTEADFWILMNETKTGKMGYTGLIISHNGCLKINDNLDNKVNPEGFWHDDEAFNNSLVFFYRDEEVYEVGEVSKDNCKNEYPYAMALKRCFDRVVLKKCKLAYAGVYSDSEADEFTSQLDETAETIDETQEKALRTLIKDNKIENNKVLEVLEKHGISKLNEIKVVELMDIRGELINDR